MNTDDVYMKSIHVPIIIETDEDGIFIVSCPQFKGCHTYGKTIDEALVRIKEVIELCMEDSQGSEHLNTFVGFREVEIVPGA
jgi:predicted RNase H-like HicB family nuclease